MKTQNWMNRTALALIATLALACGRGGQVQGHTYIATGAAGYQAGYSNYYSGYPYNSYNNGYNSYYNNPYGNGYGNNGYGNNGYGNNGYGNNGYGNNYYGNNYYGNNYYGNSYANGYAQGSSGDSISFSDNFRASYRQASSGQTYTATYSYLDSSNQILSVRLDQQQAGTASTMSTMMMGEMRFTVSNDGSQLINQNTGQVLYRQN